MEFFIFLVVTIFIFLSSAIKIVPQGEKWIIQRFGKYHQTLEPGLSFIIPFMDLVSYRVTTKDIVLDIPTQEVITKDNVVILANAIAYISIVKPERAVYGIENYRLGITSLVQTTLRSIIGEMDLDSALSSRDIIRSQLKTAISDDISDWGITLKTVEIQDITPSANMQVAMEEQASAVRQRRATVTRADGLKQAAILEAEGRLEASKREAEAQIILAEASEKAIRMISNATDENEMPLLYLLGEQYIKSVNDIAKSDNAKTVLLPADILSSVKGIIGNDKIRPN